MGQVQAAAIPALTETVSERLRADLDRVEQILIESATSQVELLQAAAHHILEAGGKRLRPQLTLLSAGASGFQGGRAVRLASVMELVHTATLVHDDIVDDSDSRRGRGTANFFWGNSASVLMGDYLVIRAFSLLAEDGDQRVLRLMCDTIARMCEGEVLQICYRGDTELTRESYFTIIDCKTATLMAACCESAATVGGATAEETRALAMFGRQLGMAFQIQDDVLDMVGDEKLLGKPVGGDLREAKVTLPVIYGLARARQRDREEIQELFQRTAPITPLDIATAVGLIHRYDGFEAARNTARDYVRSAKASLADVRPSPARDALADIADRIVEREA